MYVTVNENIGREFERARRGVGNVLKFKKTGMLEKDAI